jgi:hypothetical protein
VYSAVRTGPLNKSVLASSLKGKETAEIKYMRKTAGHTSTDYKTNTEFAKEINITPVFDKIKEYREARCNI